MKNFSLLIILFSLLLSWTANANSSFRLKNGQLLSIGSSKSEIISLAGTPLYSDVEKIAVDNGQGVNPIKREILTYELKGSIGGLYLVVITVENNKVVSIISKQKNRI